MTTRSPIENGERLCSDYYKGRRYYVDIRNDERFFTIYDDNASPCGTMQRPRVMGGDRRWHVYDMNGTELVNNVAGCIGPMTAFRAFLMSLKA